MNPISTWLDQLARPKLVAEPTGPAERTSAGWNTPPPTFTEKRTDNHRDKLDPYLSSWMDDSVKYGKQTGIDPRLVMAIVLNEGATREQKGGRAGATAYDLGRWATSPLRGEPGNSLGVTNMKEETFEKLRARYPDEFGGHQWSDLTTDEHLAVKATAYALKTMKDDTAALVPDNMRAKISLNEYLAAGYNAGEENLANYRRNGDPGPEGAAYAQRANNNFQRAQQLMSQVYVMRADGGEVNGPGSTIGDKIPAWLSDGEFVMNARSTAVNGPFLRALNADPHFLQRMLAARQAGRPAEPSVGLAPSAAASNPTQVTITASHREDIVDRLKILALQWELLHRR